MYEHYRYASGTAYTTSDVSVTAEEYKQLQPLLVIGYLCADPRLYNNEVASVELKVVENM